MKPRPGASTTKLTPACLSYLRMQTPNKKLDDQRPHQVGWRPPSFRSSALCRRSSTPRSSPGSPQRPSKDSPTKPPRQSLREVRRSFYPSSRSVLEVACCVRDLLTLVARRLGADSSGRERPSVTGNKIGKEWSQDVLVRLVLCISSDATLTSSLPSRPGRCRSFRSPNRPASLPRSCNDLSSRPR